MQTPPLVGLEFRRGLLPTEKRRTTPRNVKWRRGLGGLLSLGLGLMGCGLAPAGGDCGSQLSSAQCQVVRTQLGTLSRRPPADPTNRFGRCVADNSPECIAEDAAAVLGKRLFFDRCLSSANNVACVTCHQPSQAFTDDRVRAILGPVRVPVGGVMQTMQLPLIDNATPERLKLPPPMVQPQLDESGTPLAQWVADGSGGGNWEAVRRRPLASLGSTTGSATGRHSPSLYNVAYGGGFAALHGERTYGVTWTPWDGRYDSAWALVADVWEFGATQNTDRSHIALRIWKNLNHRAAYEQMIGGPMAINFDAKMPSMDGTDKFVYLRHGSPTGSACWYSGKQSDCPTSLPATEKVRADINEVFVNAGKALGAYMRRLRSASSPYDRWIAGDPEAMSAAAQRGLGLFIGKAECILCHNGPNFTDWRFHNLGVPNLDPEQKLAGSVLPLPPDDRSACFDGLNPNPICADPGRHGWQVRAAGQCATDSVLINGRTVSCQRVDQPPALNRFDIPMDCASAQSDATDKALQCLPASMVDAQQCRHATSADCNKDPLCQWTEAKSRCVARADSAELGQFKTPSLRNVALTFPYMHNGMLADYGPAERHETTSDDPTPHLTRVVEFYASGGGTPDTGTRDSLIRPLHLTTAEIADVVEFLKALTDNSMATSGDPLTLQPPDLDSTLDCPE